MNISAQILVRSRKNVKNICKKFVKFSKICFVHEIGGQLGLESSMYFVKSTDTTAWSKKIHSIPAADYLMLCIKNEPGAIGAYETLLIRHEVTTGQ